MSHQTAKAVKALEWESQQTVHTL